MLTKWTIIPAEQSYTYSLSDAYFGLHKTAYECCTHSDPRRCFSMDLKALEIL